MRIHLSSSFLALAATVQTVQATLPLPSKLVTQFPTRPFWIENVAVRHNGALLLTQLTQSAPATLYTVPSPWVAFSSGASSTSTSTGAKAKAIHEFSEADALLGITESLSHPDVFVLVGGVNPTANSSGKFFAWTVDFRPAHTHALPSPHLGLGPDFASSSSDPDVDVVDAGVEPKITQIANLSSQGILLPNGIASLPKGNGILIADSLAGCVWKLDISSGKVELAIKVPEMAPSKTAVGVNGIKAVGNKLYWTNSATASVFRVEIDEEGKQTTGSTAEKVATLPAVFADDFAVGPPRKEGDLLWVATNVNNTLVAVDSHTGKTEAMAGATGSLELAGATAVAFGRTEKDKGWLYVVTCGGAKAAVNGVVEAGKVVAVDTRGFVM